MIETGWLIGCLRMAFAFIGARLVARVIAAIIALMAVNFGEYAATAGQRPGPNMPGEQAHALLGVVIRPIPGRRVPQRPHRRGCRLA